VKNANCPRSPWLAAPPECPGYDNYIRGRLAVGGNLYTLHKQALADFRPALVF
jgi:hypothetical protein